MPNEDSIDEARTALTPLEIQQVHLVDPGAHTFWHWVRFDVVTDQARRCGADAVLDIGAGSGMLGDHLSRQDPELTYRFDELSTPLDAALGEHFGDEARFGTNEPVTRRTVAAMLDVIEHVEDDVALLATWRARMEPGTVLVVTVPALQWAFSDWDRALGHFRRYSRPSLRASLDAAGFDVTSCSYLFPEMLPLVVKRKLSSGGDDADMPRLSDRTNRIGYRLSSTTSRLRRLWPAGTSVVAVARVPEV